VDLICLNLINVGLAIRLAGNPLLDTSHIPSAKTLLRMLEYEYSIVVLLDGSSKYWAALDPKCIFSFDGWTPKSNTPFLRINAQFIDHDFVQYRNILGLRPPG
jgi:hypothetical protein